MSAEGQGLPPAPVYRPSEEDFADPVTYLCNIAVESSPYGIAKIIPPPSFRPPNRALEPGFRFTARRQQVVKSKEVYSVRHTDEYKSFDLESYQRQAEESCAPGDRDPEGYWRFLEERATSALATTSAECLYAADLQLSLFQDKGEGDEEWNISRIADSSLLAHVPYPIPGVTTPMFYIGSQYSMFAWHVEDNYLTSLNYHHTGHPKTWYGIPSSMAYEAEMAVRQQVSKELLGQGDVMATKCVVAPPSFFRKHDIPVYALVQQPGEFVVTFPQGFHSGFSHGYNQAEAVNLALPGWLTFAQSSVRRYRHFQKESVIDVEALVAVMAGIGDVAECAIEPTPDDISVCIDILCEEKKLRSALRAHPKVSENSGSGLDTPDGARFVCALCQHVCHFTVAFCSEVKHQEHVTCLRHSYNEISGSYKDCKQLVMYSRYEDKVLSSAVRELRAQQRGVLTMRTARLVHDARKTHTHKADPLVEKVGSKRPLPLKCEGSTGRDEVVGFQRRPAEFVTTEITSCSIK